VRRVFLSIGVINRPVFIPVIKFFSHVIILRSYAGVNLASETDHRSLSTLWDMNRFRFRTLVTSAIFFSTVLRFLVFPNTNYGATHDDELMVRLAASILRGDWLGNYSSHLLLSKPAGYPLFLAWTHFLPWATTLTVHLILLVGVLLIARELRYMGMNRGFVLLFVALSALHPQWFGSQMSRIYRDGLLTALTFLGLGLSLWLGRIIPIWLERRRFRDQISIEVVFVSLLTGLTLSWSIATKPGWYPLAIVMFTLSVRRIACIRRLKWGIWGPRLVAVGFTVTIGIASIVGYIVLQNQNHYGITQLDSFSSGSFTTALSKWTSVKSDDTRKYVLVDASQRKRVYSISPTAKKLEPYLELSWGNGWRGAACSSLLNICDESATWFVWDLRDAMHSAGLDTSAKKFEESFALLSQEITVACNSNLIHCSNDGLAPGVVALAEMSKREIVDGYATAIDWLMFPDIGYLPRGGEVAEGIMTKDWDEVIKGLPTRTKLNNYRPEVVAIGNTISLLQRLYMVIWPTLVLIAIGSFIASAFRKAWLRGLRLISTIAIFGLLLFIGQLALLEASSGMYLVAGKSLYLLPAFPFLLLSVVIELSYVSALLVQKIKSQ
jgi:hypothetical protein